MKATRTATWPPAICRQDAIANADAPPPEGSTATITWCSDLSMMRHIGSLVILIRLRSMKASTSREGNAFCDPCKNKRCGQKYNGTRFEIRKAHTSAERPMDSRSWRWQL